jgi:hypothetical protein
MKLNSVLALASLFVVAAIYMDMQRWPAIYAEEPTYRAFGLDWPTWKPNSDEANRAWDRCVQQMGEQLQAGTPARSCRRLTK